MKKILFVLDNLDIGGLQKVNVEIANNLSENNEIELLTLRKSVSYFDLKVNEIKLVNDIILFNKIEFLRGYNYFSKKILGKGLNFFISQQAQQLDKIIKEKGVETVVLNGMSLLFVKYLKNNNPSLNIIMWIHNNSEIYLERYFKHYHELFIECLRTATTVVTLTEKDKVDFSNYSKRVMKIHNPLTIQNSRISKLDNTIISFVGRIQIDQKGLDYLVEVASKLPNNWVISVAGDGDKKSVKKFKNSINDNYKIKNKIIVNGPLRGDELNNHFYNSSIYIMTSRWEGMPLVLAEAMSFGLPIIAFEQSGSNEVLDNGCFGILVNQGNVDEMVDKLKHLITSKSLREEYQKKSLLRVEDFKMKNIIDQWKKII